MFVRLFVWFENAHFNSALTYWQWLDVGMLFVNIFVFMYPAYQVAYAFPNPQYECRC